jgi:hypothetical protein
VAAALQDQTGRSLNINGPHRPGRRVNRKVHPPRNRS